ncbi:MAG: hypothetical protein RLZZ450_4016 [Pseudomonadota bacterium]|jgi:predicted enzyme related to lactoylglutathione lyase
MSKIDYKYSHGAILVSDLERSASFYNRALNRSSHSLVPVCSTAKRSC